MHQTDSYSKVTWSKPGELDGNMISAVTVRFSLIQELEGKRVKPGASEHTASRNPAKKQVDDLSGRLSRAKWSCWLKRVLGNDVDRCLRQA